MRSHFDPLKLKDRNRQLGTEIKTEPYRVYPYTIKDINNSKNNNNDNADAKIESSLNSYNESFHQLDNLDFMTAARILFTQPSKKKKFGLDFVRPSIHITYTRRKKQHIARATPNNSAGPNNAAKEGGNMCA
ncbi:hypothetical protein PTKIN_Ptkin10aG0122900 [Pterospermum kingtungense]